MKSIPYKSIFLVTIFFVFSIETYTQNYNQNQGTSARLAARELIEEGDFFLQMGDWEKALFSYTNAIQADVTYADAYMKRGRLYEKTTHSQEAIQDYSMAIHLNPYIDIYYDYRARVRMLSFDYYGAIDDVNKAIDLNASNKDYQQHKVDGFISVGEYELALNQLDSLISIDPNLSYNFQRKALLYVLNDNLPAAQEMIFKSYELGDSSYLTLDIHGLIELKYENYQRAIELFDLAIAMDSKQYISYYNRGMARRFLGETDLALEDISTAISINNQNDEAFFKRALIKKEQGDVEGAIEDYNSAITLNPDYTEAIYNRSFAYKVLGDYSSAELDVNQLIELPEDRPEYWNMKGNLLVLHGDLLAAIDCYSRAISYDNEYADAVYNRGIAFLLLNNPFKSCEDLELSIELGYSKAEVILENFCGQY